MDLMGHTWLQRRRPPVFQGLFLVAGLVERKWWSLDWSRRCPGIEREVLGF